MKTSILYRLLACFSVLALGSGTRLLAAEPNNDPPTTQSPATAATVSAAPAPVNVGGEAPLPTAAADVVKLARSQVNDDVIISYVKNSGTTARLSPDDISRMRKEGVSDRVIDAMLTQNKQAVAVAQQSATPAPVYRDGVAQNDAPPPADASVAVTPPPSTPPPAPAPPTQTAVEAPLTPPASTVHVIPYPVQTYDYYPYYPYYYGGGPIVSFRFGFGGHGHFHHHHHR